MINRTIVTIETHSDQLYWVRLNEGEYFGYFKTLEEAQKYAEEAFG